MLRELHITNMAVIEDAAIELGEGLNCFTGQTGAGKSLILGAFEVLLGLRSAQDMLRQGAEEGRVSGIFEVRNPHTLRQLNAIGDIGLAEQSTSPGGSNRNSGGFENSGGSGGNGGLQELLITRKIFASGRTSVAINGQPATLAMLAAMGEVLVDVHGQHDHQYLLKPGNQLLMLDRFGETEPLRDEYADLHHQLTQLKRRRKELMTSRTLRQQQLELYEFQAGEIDQAQLGEGEYQEISARFRVLSHLKRIAHDAAAAHAALYEAEGSIVERLGAVAAIMNELAELDEQLNTIVDTLRNALAQLQDASLDLNRYLGRLDLDGGELGEVEERLNTLNRLIQKYAPGGKAGGGTLEEVIAYHDQVRGEITRLRSQTEDLRTIEKQIQPVEQQLNQAGIELTRRRRLAAEKLQPLVESELAELGMAEARFEVSFEQASDHADQPPAPTPDETTGAASGMDRVEMVVAANPGQPARPLRKVASGGELSRIMLALKSILAQTDRTSVLVFDEIDANVGGRMGTVIGDKLRGLAQHHQVLCITHLPQIAAYADHHLKITKIVEAGETRTAVRVMRDDDRVDELAEMLTGKHATQTTRQQAAELLDMAKDNAKKTKPAKSTPPGNQPRTRAASSAGKKKTRR